MILHFTYNQLQHYYLYIKGTHENTQCMQRTCNFRTYTIIKNLPTWAIKYLMNETNLIGVSPICNKIRAYHKL